jgi:hypothetical protein
MAIKIKIKTDTFELDYDGPEQFLKDELPAMLAIVQKLQLRPFENDPGVKHTHKSPGAIHGSTPGRLSVSTIATRLTEKTGPSLVLAAAANFAFFQDKSTFTRRELLTAMKTGTSFYRRSYSANLGKYLKSLVTSSALNDVGNETYALNEKKAKELKDQLDLS